MRAKRASLAAVLAIGVFGLAPSSVSGGDVRPLQARGARLLEEGLRRSPALAALVSEIRGSDVVVYVDLDPDAPGSYEGALRFRAAAAGVRYLHVWLQPRRCDGSLIELLAHELRHAAEVANVPDVRSAAAFDTLYASIGKSRLRGRYETDAAQAVAAQVRRELERAPGGRQ